MEQLERKRGPMVEPSPIEEYRPSRIEALQQHEIRIRFLSRGCIISVGCKDIAFENISEALGAFNLYVTNPYEEKRKWRNILE